MNITTSDDTLIRPFLDKMRIPPPISHKGQNGKVMVIGGSSLFHAASLWSAEIISHFADMVHYASTEENNEIMQKLKSTFRNGIVISRKDIPSYAQEDDVILIGPGLVRSSARQKLSASEAQRVRSSGSKQLTWEEVLPQHESEFSREVVCYLFHQFPHKRFVIDAGALQMIRPDIILQLTQKCILTPHQGEFETLFGIALQGLTQKEKVSHVRSMAKKYGCVILLKAVYDIVSDGECEIIIEGGNAGLTKGGSGDVLAGITASLYAHAEPVSAAVVASYILKKTADYLALKKGLWYNTSDLIDNVPDIFARVVYNDYV